MIEDDDRNWQQGLGFFDEMQASIVFQNSFNFIDRLFDVIWKIDNRIQMPIFNPEYTYIQQRHLINKIYRKTLQIKQLKQQFFYLLKCLYILYTKQQITNQLLHKHTIDYQNYQNNIRIQKHLQQKCKQINNDTFLSTLTNRKLKLIFHQIHDIDYKQLFQEKQQDYVESQYYYNKGFHFYSLMTKPTSKVFYAIYHKMNSILQNMIKISQSIISFSIKNHSRIIEYPSQSLILNTYRQNRSIFENIDHQYSKRRSSYTSLQRLSHISFRNLKSLFLKGCYLQSIEGLAWWDCPTLKRIQISSHPITSLKPLKKTNFSQLQDFLLWTYAEEQQIEEQEQQQYDLEQLPLKSIIQPNSNQLKSLCRMRFTSNKSIRLSLYSKLDRYHNRIQQTSVQSSFHMKFYPLYISSQYQQRYFYQQFYNRLSTNAFIEKNKRFKQGSWMQSLRQKQIKRSQSQLNRHNPELRQLKVFQVRQLISRKIGTHKQEKLYNFGKEQGQLTESEVIRIQRRAQKFNRKGFWSQNRLRQKINQRDIFSGDPALYRSRR